MLRGAPDYSVDVDESFVVVVALKSLLPTRCNTEKKVAIFSARVKASPRPGAQAVSDAVGSVAATAVILAPMVGAAVATDQVAMAVIGFISCSSPADRQALANVRALAPLALANNFVGVVLGNLLLVLVVLTTQIMIFCVLSALRRGGIDVVSRMSRLKIPSLSLSCMIGLYQGTSFASSQLLSTGTSAAEVLVGCIGGIVLVALPVSLVVAVHRLQYRQFHCYRMRQWLVEKEINVQIRHVLPLGTLAANPLRGVIGSSAGNVRL